MKNLTRLWFFQWSCMDVRVGLWRKLSAEELIFWTVMLEKTLGSPLDSKEIKPVNSKGNQSWILEGLMLKLKLQYFGYLMRRADLLEKTLMLGKIEDKRRRGQQRMRWFDGIHQLSGHEFEQTLGDDEGQGSLACCSSWGCKKLDVT